MTRLSVLLAAPLIALALPTAALAHPKLLSSTPAAKATVSKTKEITGIDLTMTSMPGMANHGPMKVSGFKTSVSPDGKTLIATLPRPLPAGGYDLKWHAVAADTHRIEGKFSFSVK